MGIINNNPLARIFNKPVDNDDVEALEGTVSIDSSNSQSGTGNTLSFSGSTASDLKTIFDAGTDGKIKADFRSVLIRGVKDAITGNEEIQGALDEFDGKAAIKNRQIAIDMVDIVIADIAVQINKDNMDLSSTIKTQNDLANSDKSKLNPKTMWAEMSADTFKTILEETNSALNEKLKTAYTGAKGSNTTIEEGVNLLSPQIKSVEDKINSNNRGLAFNGKKLLMIGLPLAGATMIGIGLADPFGVHNLKGNPIDLTPASPGLVEGSSNEILDKIGSFKSNQNPDKSDISNIANELFLQNSETQLMKVIAKGKQDIVENKDGSHTAVLKISNPYQDSEYVADVTLFTNDDPNIFEKYILVVPREVSASNPIFYIGNDGTFEKSDTEIPGLDKILK